MGIDIGMSEYRPLTPEFRRELKTIADEQSLDLDACQDTVFVEAQRLGLEAFMMLLNALPDGYPMPLKKK